jgi:hypothetical protein
VHAAPPSRLYAQAARPGSVLSTGRALFGGHDMAKPLELDLAALVFSLGFIVLFMILT